MSRDYSKLFPDSAAPAPRKASLLQRLGWGAFFAQQVDADELAETPPVRVIEAHRNGLHVIGEGIDTMTPPIADTAVGDWLLLDDGLPGHSRVLDRKSLFKRRAPGTGREVQLIAANVDTVFIVTSCNQDFNIARLERYIALAFEAEVTPVIILTKPDLCDDPGIYVQQAETISDQVPVLLLDARGEEPAKKLANWCKTGQTIAFLGSSGVGKSTLVNALSGGQTVATQGIREDDAKGRHTTTRRQLHLLDQGYTVMDTPGMRELQMTDASDGIADLFNDLTELAQQCRFRDCQHDTEPGCAILAAIESGDIDAVRMARWRKLVAEERFNSSTLAERKAADKSLQKLINLHQKHNRK